MSITSKRVVHVEFSGDISEGLIQSALDNIFALGQSDLISLAIGDTTILSPNLSGFAVTGLTIIPPAGNTSLITLKGVSGDTGIPLHKTDPTSIALDSTFLSLVLTVTVAVNGVRLVWS